MANKNENKKNTHTIFRCGRRPRSYVCVHANYSGIEAYNNKKIVGLELSTSERI